MTRLQFTTQINAPVRTVFDLARCVDTHVESTRQTGETIVGGRTSGLLMAGETVTWQGRHFGFMLTHQSKISQMADPVSFTDEMVSGRFKSFRHDHYFEQVQGGTRMHDLVEYETPYGIVGRAFDRLLLRTHLTKLIANRNAYLKRASEAKNQNSRSV